MPLTPRTLAVEAAALATLVTLAGCGSSSSPDPLASFTTQQIAWTECDPTVVPAGQRANLALLGSAARCTFARVPIDYAHPASGELRVALLRVSAADPSMRRGAILLNPGGPGDDGLFLAPLFAVLWRSANPDDAIGAMYVELARRYDLVGFSPRGTGASTQLDCSSPEQLSFVANPASDRSPENVAAMLRNGRIQAAGCRTSPLTPFINTDATARDMDVVRAALGDAKIGYFGLSYGTWLGAWWASLFPERVDRLLLSGVVDLTKGLSNIFPLQAMGQQRTWEEAIVPWAAANPDRYRLGDTVAEVRAAYAGLREETKQALNVILTAEMGAEQARDHQLLALLSATVVDAILAQSPPPAEVFDAYGRIEAAIAFVPDDGRRAVVRDLVRQLLRSDFEIFDRVTSTNAFSGGGATQAAVICNDGPFGYDTGEWVILQDRLAALYPLQGGLTTGSPCLTWAPPSVTRPPLAWAGQAGPILLTQTEFDPQTPLEGAQASLAAMPTARMLQVDGGWNHGVVAPSGNACTDEIVARYLLDGRVPEARETHCPHATAAATSRPFLDPARAETLRAQIAELLAPRR